MGVVPYRGEESEGRRGRRTRLLLPNLHFLGWRLGLERDDRVKSGYMQIQGKTQKQEDKTHDKITHGKGKDNTKDQKRDKTNANAIQDTPRRLDNHKIRDP
jgi:hypothetical protein